MGLRLGLRLGLGLGIGLGFGLGSGLGSGLGLGHSVRVRFGSAACATTDDGTVPSCGACVDVAVGLGLKVRFRARLGKLPPSPSPTQAFAIYRTERVTMPSAMAVDFAASLIR